MSTQDEGSFRDLSPLVTRPLRPIAFAAVVSLCRLYFSAFARFEVHHLDRLVAAVEHRPAGVGLLTVMNHSSVIDEPTFGAIVPWKWALDPNRVMRWTLAAKDFCFTNPVFSAFFRLMKAIPIVRGAGLDQIGLVHAQQLVQRGEWLHVYPEGRVSQTGDVQRVRRGVARLAEVDPSPVILPIYVAGIEKAVPLGTWFPRAMRTITMVIGEAVNYHDILLSFQRGEISRREYDEMLAKRIQDALEETREEADAIHEVRIRKRLGLPA